MLERTALCVTGQENSLGTIQTRLWSGNFKATRLANVFLYDSNKLKLVHIELWWFWIFMFIFPVWSSWTQRIVERGIPSSSVWTQTLFRATKFNKTVFHFDHLKIHVTANICPWARLDNDDGYLDGLWWYSWVWDLLQVSGQVLIHVLKDQSEFRFSVSPGHCTYIEQPRKRATGRGRWMGGGSHCNVAQSPQ